MSTPDQPLPAEIEVIALAVLGKRVKEQENLSRAVIAGNFGPGDKHTFRSPVDGLKLGQIWRTDPDSRWTVTDREALHAFLRQEDVTSGAAADPDRGGNVETVYEIASEAEAIQVLRELAPHVLAVVERVSDLAVKAAVERAKNGEAIPGVEKKTPDGSLTVKADPQAADAISGLIAAGQLTWDGRRVLEQKTEEAS